MRWQFFIFCLSLFLTSQAFSQTKTLLPVKFREPILKELKPFFSPSEGQSEVLLKGEVISVSKVITPAPQKQQLMLFVAGVHPKTCTKAMRKLSLYENYPQYISFIKESKYNDQTQKISMTIDHALLPFAMLMSFKIPRIRGEGHYPFVFEDGFLKNLKGTIIVKDIDASCLMAMKVDWEGPETSIPNIIFGPFLQTVGKAGLEHLIRVSLF